MPFIKNESTLANEMMKKMFVMILALVFALSLTACGGSKQDAVTPEQNTEPGTEVETAPSGVEDDGIGEDPSFGEGIGEVVALTPEEESYMLAQTTNSWLKLSRQEKDDLVVLVGRSLEASDGFIVENYDDLVAMLDHQMEQYFRNSVDEGVLATVRDIYGIG